MEKKNRINDSDPNTDYSRTETGVPEEHITSEQIEQSELSENKREIQDGDREFRGVSNSNIDRSPEEKGNIGVQQSNQSDYEKEKYNKDADAIKGGGDTGEGRGAGADRA